MAATTGPVCLQSPHTHRPVYGIPHRRAPECEEPKHYPQLLGTTIAVLKRFPRDLIQGSFDSLAEGMSFSRKMRDKLRAAAESNPHRDDWLLPLYYGPPRAWMAATKETVGKRSQDSSPPHLILRPGGNRHAACHVIGKSRF